MTQKPRQIPLFADTPKGDAAVPYTYAVMRESAVALARRSRDQLLRVVIASANSYRIRQEITNPLAQAMGEMRMRGEVVDGVFGFVRRLHAWAASYTFKPDPLGIELINDPLYKDKADWRGDCDDRAVLMAAVCEVCGVPYRFVSVSRSGDRLEHVFIMCFIKYPVGLRALLLDPQEEREPDVMTRTYSRWLIESYPHKESR